ncbi:hypothetical protein [Lysobacter gummosus]
MSQKPGTSGVQSEALGRSDEAEFPPRCSVWPLDCGTTACMA